MKTKILLIFLIMASFLLTSCMAPPDMRCNYDGICEDWETDNCPDCADVLGRGVPIPPPKTSNEDIVLT